MFNSSYLVINTRLVYVLIDSCSMHVLLLLVAFRSTTCFVHIPNILTGNSVNLVSFMFSISLLFSFFLSALMSLPFSILAKLS